MTQREITIPAALDIKRNSDGVIRRSPTLWEWSDAFIWEEGNFACDCNRHLFFERAAGREGEDCDCGAELYSVRLYSVEDGGLLYEDGEWP